MERWKISGLVFTTALSVILIEILFTRIFAAMYFSSFAFLIISLALFGTGISGFYFSMGKKKKYSDNLPGYIFLFALSLPVVIKTVLTIKIDFLNLFDPITNIFYLLVNFFILLIPFFLGGSILVRIFSLYSSEIGSLYFFDLSGAALGSLLVLPLITYSGPSGSFILVSAFMLLFWLFFTKKKSIIKYSVFSILIILFAFMFRYSEDLFPVVPKIEKRDYKSDLEKGRIEHSEWSPINKIDIAPFIFNPRKKVIWLNCGTQQSWLVRTKKEDVGKEKIEWTHTSIPFQLTEKGSALIIGSAGGYEVLCAISNGFKRIVAVEMDPKLCSLVEGKYSDFIGGIFKRRGVYLLNDEGRSILKRLNKTFNVIQMVNSHPRDTLLSGGLSISETYIYTVEAFKDYWKYLKEDGFLSIVHIYGERMFSTAFQALKEMGIDNPEQKFFVIQAPKGFNYFFMKKGNINNKDHSILSKFAGNREVVFAPAGHPAPGGHHDPFLKNESAYYKLAGKVSEQFVNSSSVNITPVYDNSPYFNQPNRIGQFHFKNNIIKGMARTKVDGVLKYTNAVYLSLLVISIIFSVFLIYIPMRKKIQQRSEYKMILFFSMIGAGFIMTEIILIKIFQLLLGNPSYSISVIIFAILISAGIGSFFSEKIYMIFKGKMLYVSFFVAVILIIYSLFLFPAIYQVLQFPLIPRALITILFLSIPGIPMGVFFPIAIRSIVDKGNNSIGWAWGANAFATVMGSVIIIIISINLNFSAGLITAAMIYLSAGILFPRSQ
ncbi:MAG: hypothetical protein ABFR75_09165 [Acidobacteriota bacterium]